MFCVRYISPLIAKNHPLTVTNLPFTTVFPEHIGIWMSLPCLRKHQHLVLLSFLFLLGRGITILGGLPADKKIEAVPIQQAKAEQYLDAKSQ